VSELRHKGDTRSGGPFPIQPADNRSLEQYLDELVEQFDRLRLTDRRRGPLAIWIRQVEAEIDARSGL
jgi:hypothetical protein